MKISGFVTFRSNDSHMVKIAIYLPSAGFPIHLRKYKVFDHSIIIHSGDMTEPNSPSFLFPMSSFRIMSRMRVTVHTEDARLLNASVT